MKDLALDDLQRLAMEVGFATGNPEEWAEKAGFPFDVLLDIGASANQVVKDKMLAAANRAFGDNVEDWPEPGSESFQLVDVDFGSLIRDACISSFVLGFEAHKEFGGTSDDQQS